jgi:hypothetical protein
MKKLTMIIMLAVAIVGTAQSAVTVNVPEARVRKVLLITRTAYGSTIVEEGAHTLTFSDLYGTIITRFVFVGIDDNTTYIQTFVSSSVATTEKNRQLAEAQEKLLVKDIAKMEKGGSHDTTSIP